MNEIVIDLGLLTAATVVLGFVLNQGYTLVAGVLRKRWPRIPEKISSTGKKGVVFLTAVGVTIVSADLGFIALPPVADNPAAYASALVGYIGVAFKTAEDVYDHFWQALVAA